MWSNWMSMDFNLGPSIKAFPCNPQWWQSWLIFNSAHIQVRLRESNNPSTEWSWASDEDAWILDTTNRVNLQASEAHSTNILASVSVGQMARHPNRCNLRQAAGKPVSDTLHCSDRGMMDAWRKQRLCHHLLRFQQTCDMPTWQHDNTRKTNAAAPPAVIAAVHRWLSAQSLDEMPLELCSEAALATELPMP